MSNPIIELQTSILAKLSADTALSGAIGANAIFDLPPKGKRAPYLVIMRHDVLNRDADISTGYDHRIQIRAWVAEASRAEAIALADRVILALKNEDLNTADLAVTHVHHQRTDTAVEIKSGRAHATVSFRILSEPTS